MNAGRFVLLFILTVLLAGVLIGTQLVVLAQQTVLKTSFMRPEMDKLNTTIATPKTHEAIVRYVAGQAIDSSRLRNINASLREYLMKASIKALDAQWMQEEVTAVADEALDMLRGKSHELQHTIYLNRRKEILISELARVLPPGMESELRSASAGYPDSVELTSLTGKEVPEALATVSKYSMPVSLLSYIAPAVLALLALQVGRIGWGIVGIGISSLASGLAAGAAYVVAWPKGVEIAINAVGRRVPAAFSWFSDFLRLMLEDVRASGRTLSVELAAAGAVLLIVGIIVVAATRKKKAA